MAQYGFFDIEDRYKSLTKFGDPLEKIKKLINFEVFRETLEKAFGFSVGPKGGHPAYDSVLILKILILQTLYNLSDDQIEFQIKDRLSFMRFLDLIPPDKIPDAKTVWLYRERLTQKGLIDKLFMQFDELLKAEGYLAMSGQIVDAAIVSAPRQRLTKEEKETIKNGEIPEDWKTKPAKLAQKDRDARWIIQQSRAKATEGKKQCDIAIPFYGYKNHITTDKRFGLIRKYTVSDASLYDGKALKKILDKENTACRVWGDTAYRSEKNEALLMKEGFVSQIHRKKPNGNPMPK